MGQREYDYKQGQKDANNNLQPPKGASADYLKGRQDQQDKNNKK